MTIVNTPIGGTEQSEIVSVAINGLGIGQFDTLSGGGSTATVPQHRSGGQRNQTSYRVRPKFGPIKVSRVCQQPGDWELIRDLTPFSGLVQASVTIQPVDADLNVVGSSRTASGMFQGIDDVTVDVNSEGLQMFTINITVDSWQ